MFVTYEESGTSLDSGILFASEEHGAEVATLELPTAATVGRKKYLPREYPNEEVSGWQASITIAENS